MINLKEKLNKITRDEWIVIIFSIIVISISYVYMIMYL